MAVGFRAVGSWENGTTGLTADEVLAIPAAQVTGDMILVLASWKSYTITAQISGYTEITEIADGTVASGTSVGSMKVGGWYKEATSDTESDPTLDFSSAPSVGEAAVLVFSKGSGETWYAPKFVTAAWPLASSQTVNASSTVDVRNASAVACIIGIRDDTASFTRSTTSISESGSGITFNGNYVEAPSPYASTITGGDMSASAGYRLVTTGMTGATLQAEATLATSETGMILWVVLEATTLITPSVGSLTLTGLAPTVTVAAAGSSYSGVPGTASLVLTGLAPTVTAPALVTPSVGSLILTGLAPTVSIGTIVVPATGSLTLTGLAPSVATPVLVTPAVGSLALTGIAPSVVVGVNVVPGVGSLLLSGLAPTVLTPRLVTPSTGSLTLNGIAPTVTTAPAASGTRMSQVIFFS